MTRKLGDQGKTCYCENVDEQELYRDFAESAAKITADAINRVNPVGRQLLADALAEGIGELVLVVSFDPVTIIGTLRSTRTELDPQVLFRIQGKCGDCKGGDMPSDVSH